MVQRVQTTLISDLSGDEVEDGRGSVLFSYNGTRYSIDLTAKEAAGFDRAIAMYVQHARPADEPTRPDCPGRTSGSPRGGGSDHRLRIHNMKKWAADQGLEYPKRGRLPKSLVDAYDAAH